MEFRKLGKTGKEVSVIGLGCEHLDRKPYAQVEETVNAVLEYGVNIFDVFMPGMEIRENIAKALGNRRDKVMIQGHIGASDVNQQYDISRDMPTVKKYFENLLRIFGGHIDFGMLFFIDTEKNYNDIFETEFVKYAEHLKKQGDISHIGFSSHNPEMAIKAINTGIPEMLMFSVNPAFDMLPSTEYVFDHFDNGFTPELLTGIDPKRAELYKLCEQKQVGITVMKTYGAGKLLSKDHTPFDKPMTVPQCINYALSRPGVSCILPGCQTAAEVHDTMRYFETTAEERNYTEVVFSGKNDFKGSCVYCSHCQPCPVEIDIAAVTKLLDIANLDRDNVPPSIKSHYQNLAHKGDECIKCGHCEERCPFSVPIIQNMADAAELL
ncbi:MAG: aldo/keto reductase [Oscillospiraceae bacterium]|nr:aldo/keto reductase [Oscillospiraceae bacterium]